MSTESKKPSSHGIPIGDFWPEAEKPTTIDGDGLGQANLQLPQDQIVAFCGCWKVFVLALLGLVFGVGFPPDKDMYPQGRDPA